MDFNEIENLIQAKSKLKVCHICGTPFKPYHSRQKTCGNPECKRLHHIEEVKKRTARKKAENPEEYKKERREYSRKARLKKKNASKREAQLKELSKHWEKQSEFDRKIAEYGLEYGKRSAEKVLATIPKIDVSAFGKENENEQNLCNKDEPHKGAE